MLICSGPQSNLNAIPKLGVKPPRSGRVATNFSRLVQGTWQSDLQERPPVFEGFAAEPAPGP